MFCSQCGSELQADARFCAKCGAAVAGGAPETAGETGHTVAREPAPPAVAPVAAAEPVTVTPPRAAGKPWLLYGLAAVVVLALGGGGVIWSIMRPRANLTPPPSPNSPSVETATETETRIAVKIKEKAGRARSRARQATCNSNIRQMAVAIQMYAQDNGGQYPGIDGSSWVSKIAPYLGGSVTMFGCPSSDTTEHDAVNYALAGILIRENGAGVKESQVISPSEVGALCDATPAAVYPSGRLIGGGGSQPMESIGAKIAIRHGRNPGAIVGFCDGHSKFFESDCLERDTTDGVVRALYGASPLELIDNPVGCIGPCKKILGTGVITIGGEYNTRPLLMAAAKIYGNYYTRGFLGFNNTIDRPPAKWAWGRTSGAERPAKRAIARDALIFIVARSSKIPDLPALVNSTYVVDTGFLRGCFSRGYRSNEIQVYHMPESYSQTDRYARSIAGITTYGSDSIVVDNDAEMMEKVSNDPYGIGYCSSLYADPDRVVILGFAGKGKGGRDAIWPRADEKQRWVVPATAAESDWPFKRSIDVDCSNDALGKSIQAALRGGDLYRNLTTGPLFMAGGYWPGDY